MNTAALRLASAAALLLLAIPALRAALPITENFSSYSVGSVPSSGTNSYLADPGFGGTVTDAWVSGWRSAASNVTPRGSVSSASPLNGGGNYFSTTLEASTSSTALNYGAVGRAYAATANGLTTTAHTLSFDFRFDALPSTMKFDIFDASGRSNSPGTGTAWQLTNNGGVWSYWNGSTNVATSMSVVIGTTYSIAINVNPVANTYGFSIGNGVTSVSAADLGFRTSGFATDGNGGRWLEFGAYELSDVAGQTAGYSIDNITISSVPEPSAFALLAGLSMLGFTARRRRHAL